MRRSALGLLFVCTITACGLEGRPQDETPPPSASAVVQPSAVVTTPMPSATRSAVARVPSGTPGPPPGCRNSTAVACGAFRFDPDPNDEPLVMKVTFTPSAPKVGDVVRFNVTSNDADASRIRFGTYRFGDDSRATIGRPENDRRCPRAYGPWDPPPKGAGASNRLFEHRFTEAGTFEATFTATSRSTGRSDPPPFPGDEDGLCIDPYESAGKVDVSVTVR